VTTFEISIVLGTKYRVYQDSIQSQVKNLTQTGFGEDSELGKLG